MKERALTTAQMRFADEYTVNAGIPAEELMCRAGLAIADEVQKKATELTAPEILVVCGCGNNGGDGYVCAQELKNRGLSVQVYAFDGNYSFDCKREKERYNGGYSNDICGSIIVDCIFGTGLSRDVSGEFADFIDKINNSGAYIVSADIPSGINGDNGLVMGSAVKANLTVAVAEYKAGMFLNDGLDFCGEIIKKDIGIICPQENYASVNFSDNKSWYPKRKRNSHKGTYGSANLIAGSNRYIGAAALAAEAALKSGCGYVKLSTTERVTSALAVKLPQVIYLTEADVCSDAIAVGMGCGASKELYAQIKKLLSEYGGKLIIDADGLNAIAKYGVGILKRKNCNVIITPHIKEFSRLTGIEINKIEANPVEIAQNFAREYNITVLLKSAASIITDGQKTVINTFGCSALAKGGSGDMLSGFLCGTLARGLDIFNGAVCSAQTLGFAAEIAAEEKTEYCTTAKDILKNLHLSVMRLT
ncbi:MAG: NAD(P)H-hydrate dehydratase [Clostridia bacterium]|nr:NAD(P)H-hydrate dehydratase [Clostridia bacterium]